MNIQEHRGSMYVVGHGDRESSKAALAQGTCHKEAARADFAFQVYPRFRKRPSMESLLITLECQLWGKRRLG